MAGFFVSNSFGKFHSESKVFNATMSGFGGSTSSGTFQEALTGTGAWQSGSTLIDHDFKKKDDNSVYVGYGGTLPSFLQWTDPDTMEFKGSYDYGAHIKGSNNVVAVYEIEVPSDCVLGGSGHISPVVNWNGTNISLLTAAAKSDFPTITKIANNKVRVELNKSGTYISLDPGADVSGIGTFTVAVTDKNGKIWKFERDNSASEKLSRANACSNAGGRYGTPIYLKLISWTKYNDGCMDTTASNYDSNANRDDGNCQYQIAEIKTFTISKTSVVQGVSDQVNFFWELDTANGEKADLVTLYVTNADGTDQEITTWGPYVYSQNYTYNTASLPVGTSTFKLVSSWASNPGNTEKDTVSLTVNSPQTLLSCDDPNASKFGETSDTGDCGDCNSGYTRGTDGLCQKSGCMDDTDANYDPDAVIDDASACYGDDSTGGNGGNGDTNGDNGDGGTTTTTTTTTTTATQGDKEESPNLLIPVLLGGAILGGVLLLRR